MELVYKIGKNCLLDAIIEDLNKKLFQRECNELKSLQKQIDVLLQINDEKEKAIKKLETDVNDIKDNCIAAEDSSDLVNTFQPF